MAAHDAYMLQETGGHMITPLVGAWPPKPGSATLPFFGGYWAAGAAGESSYVTHVKCTCMGKPDHQNRKKLQSCVGA
jgi:hypothetical protein